MQICWLVSDLETAIRGWVEQAGVGPFFWFDEVPFTDGRYRGTPAAFPTSTAAIAYAGDLQIELVCQDNDEPGVFRDVYERGQSGLHHMALICQQYEIERDAYISSGAALVFEGRIGNTRTCWLDTTQTLGFMVELLESSEGRLATFANMRAAAQQWDGTEPIRRS